MSPKKQKLLVCCLRSLGAFAVLSVAFLCFVALGIKNSSNDIAAFAARLVVSDAAIFGFSAVYGFSFLITEAKKIPSAAKRFLHVMVNYIACVLCFAALFANVKDADVGGWTVFVFFVSFVYFVIYGIATLVTFLVRRAKRS